jgi:hypothetical protein
MAKRIILIQSSKESKANGLLAEELKTGLKEARVDR